MNRMPHKDRPPVPHPPTTSKRRPAAPGIWQNRVWPCAVFALLALAAGSQSHVCGQTSAAPQARSATELIVMVGAAGSDEYAEEFANWAERWQQAATAAQASCHTLGLNPPGEQTDRQRLESLLKDAQTDNDLPLWLVLIGHGTFFRDVAKFNAQGPDFSASELASWLAPLRRPLVIVNCTSSSGPFINRLSAPGRVIVTGTQSGDEQNYARFGGYLAEAILDPAADLDHDREVSLLEAFLRASHDVADFYDEESRLATEHALIDDNGDGRGTPATFFRGMHAVQRAANEAAVDGALAKRCILVPRHDRPELSARQQSQRDQLEGRLSELRAQREGMVESEYLDRLEQLLVPLARLNVATDRPDETAPPAESNDVGRASTTEP